MSNDLRHALLHFFGEVDGVHLAPDIPRGKLAAARASMGTFLDEDEVVLALYDDTLFGGGDDGWLLTRRRLCWRNFLEQPQQVLLGEVEAARVKAWPKAVLVQGSKVDVHAGERPSQALADMLVAVARNEVTVERVPPTLAGLAAAIADAFLVEVGKADDLYYAPHIPTRKEKGARRAHAEHLPADERLLLLYDDTVFGSAEEGFLVTAARLAWKNIGEDAQQLPWPAVDPDRVAQQPDAIRVAAGRIAITARHELRAPVAAAIVAAARLAREHRPAGVPMADTGLGSRCGFCGRRSAAGDTTCGGCGAPL